MLWDIIFAVSFCHFSHKPVCVRKGVEKVDRYIFSTQGSSPEKSSQTSEQNVGNELNT